MLRHLKFAAYAAVSVVFTSAAVGGISSSPADASGESHDYLVVAASDVSAKTISHVVEAAGGRIVRLNTATGILTVRSTHRGFDARLRANPAVAAAGPSRPIGRTSRPSRNGEEAAPTAGARRPTVYSTPDIGIEPKPEPLERLQWDLDAVGAGYLDSHIINQGSPKVTVGVMDSGIDVSHPDLAASVDRSRSRNLLLPGMPGYGVDPTKDSAGHGTQVAGHIAAAINGLGVSGVAPKTTLASLRVGTDDGYIFVQPVVDALTSAADNGIDIVNMSFGLDPWLFACPNNAADTPDQRAEQKAVILAMQRAVDYAYGRGVMPIASEGNGNGYTSRGIDLGHPTVDNDSPTFPVDTAHPRTLDNACLLLPAESNHVVAVSATGPSGRKAYYSNYGTEQTDVAAPGGDYYDNPTSTRDVTRGSLSTASEEALRSQGLIDANGNPAGPSVIRNCKVGGPCAYYQYSSGTSFSAPITAGVAAILAAKYGSVDPRRPAELRIDPATVETKLYATAVPTGCPAAGSYTYTLNLPDGTTEVLKHVCAGTTGFNGFYGHGMVNALNAAMS